MSANKLRQGFIIVLIVAGLFFLGRFTAPKGKDNLEYEKEVEALEADIRKNQDAFAVAVDSMNHYKIMADTWFKLANKEQKSKVIIRTIYRNDTAFNHSLSVLQRDSVIRTVFLHK